jgi:hypothetical protein
MANAHKFPYTIFSLDEGGVIVPTREDNGLNLYPGTGVEITAPIYQRTLNRHGDSWLDYNDEEQIDAWGAIRFGSSADVASASAALAATARKRSLLEERAFLARNNPAANRASLAAARLEAIDAELGA